MPSWRKVIVSGSDASLNSLNAPSITGSLQGSSSFAVSASRATSASFLTSNTNAFIQGGNSFGAFGTLGTNDGQPLIFITSGSNRMYVSTVGDVGIGTGPLGAKFHVSGNANLVNWEGQSHAYQSFYPQGYGDGRFAYIGYAVSSSEEFSITSEHGTGNMVLGTSGSTRMFISSSGSVGIGTTNPSLGLLQVAGNIYANSVTGSGLLITGSSTSDLSRIIQAGSGSALNITHQNGTSATSIAQLYGGVTPRFNFRSDGLFSWGQNATGSSYGFLSWDTGKQTIGAVGVNNLSLFTNGSERMTISSSGLIGIGITTPSASLHITNTTTTNSFLVEDSTNPDNTPFLIDNIGNTMIGTTSSLGPLTVRGDGATGVTMDTDAAAGQANQSTRLFFKVSGSNRDISIRNFSGSFVLGTRGTSGTSSGTSVMVISASGDTGIGSGFVPSAARVATLQVSGNISIETGDAYKQDGNNVIYISKGADAFYANTIGGPGAGTTGLLRQTVYGFAAGALATGSFQTAVGVNAGYLNSGSDQTAIGALAGYLNSGSLQTAIGSNAGYQNSGNDTTSIGYLAGRSNSGYGQVAIGAFTGQYNIGSYQTAVGQQAGLYNTGSNQTAIGALAGLSNSGSNQTAIGYSAGLRNSGSNQTAVGLFAGVDNLSSYQTAIGRDAGYKNSGSNQTAVGYQAGYVNTGSSQTAVGVNAGYLNSGSFQTALGSAAGYENTGNTQTAVGGYAGVRNVTTAQTAIGYYAGYENSGSNQTAVGYYAGWENSGSAQTAIGVQAGYLNTGSLQTVVGTLAGYLNRGSDQTAVGYEAGYYNSGSNQTAIGVDAGYLNSGSFQTVVGGLAGSRNSAEQQTAVGYNSGRSNSGSLQTAVGSNAGYVNVGVNQTAIGASAGYYNSGSSQTTIGVSSGQYNSGSNQTVVGVSAGQYNSGSNQTAIGHSAGRNNASRDQTAVGYVAGQYNSGSSQTAIGYGAGTFNSASNQTTVGYGSGQTNEGEYQTAIGVQSGQNNIGDAQTAVGYFAGARNSGSNQTAVGYSAGYLNSGSDNTNIGYNAGYLISAGLVNSQSVQSVFLGSQTTAGGANRTNQIVIGYNASGIGSNSVVLGNNSILTTALKGFVGIGTTSPTASLHITNTSTSASFLVEDNTNPDSTPFVIDATGNVGIGTTSPTAKLTVQVTGSAASALVANFIKSPAAANETGSTFIRISSYPTLITGSGQYTDIEYNSGYAGPFRYGTYGDTNIINGNRDTNGNNGSINFVTSGSTRMTVAGGTSAGNVGIGTINPTAKLEVNGNLLLSSSVTTTININSAAVRTYIASEGAGTSFGALSNHPVNFYQSGSIKMFIDNNGGNTVISGSLAVGTSSIGPSENTLTLGARDNIQEGGQVGFNAPGGTYTSASFIDNWQNKARILKGNNTTSTGLIAQWDIHTTQMQLPGYTAAASFPGTATGYLAFDSSGNIITTAGVGGSPFPFTGDAVITGSLTVTQPIYVPINGGMYLQGGDDAALYDINVSNHMGIYGVQDSTVASVKLGSDGGIISGKSGNIGIGTINPTSASLTVNGNVWATSFTGSLQGTSSYADTASISNATLLTQLLVINQTGFTINKGAVVRISGSNNASDIPRITTASYESDSVSANTLGIASAAITNGSQGYITTEGVLTGISTTGWPSGTLLFLGAAGSITATVPQAPLHAVRLGQVIREQNVNGSISIRVDNGYELNELHDITDNTTTTSYGDLLIKSGSVWKNSTQLTGSYALTGSLTVTGSLSVNNTLFTSTTATANIGSTTIYSVSTSSYDAAWFEYVARSGSNARAGQIMSIESGSAVNFTETTTTDFGSTSGLSLGVYIVNGAMALTASAATNGWSIKTIVRSI